MFKNILAVTVTAAMGIAAATAFAAAEHTVSSTASKNKTGSKAKPAQFNAKWTYSVSDATGARAPAPNTWAWKWDGVKVDGSKFPKCTAEKIDAAQSDSVCPKGSLVATAPFTAKLGPDANPMSSVTCSGKTVRTYNAGANKQAILIVGPGTNCAGIGYLAPATITMKTVGRTTTMTLAFPENITHPLPGIAGGLTDISTSYKPLSKKVGKKTYYYMSSTSCSSQRKFTFTVTDSTGTTTKTANAGRCTK
jgi:hypothetical protein